MRDEGGRNDYLDGMCQKDHRVSRMRAQSNDFRLRIAGLVCATVLAFTFLLIGAWLIYGGAPAVGVSLLVTAVAGLVGTAVYGHKAVKSAP